MVTQLSAASCAYCLALFMPRRSAQEFCSAKCRSAYHVDHGAEGSVASVRRIHRGASIVVHLTGPAAERALKLRLRERVRVVSHD